MRPNPTRRNAKETLQTSIDNLAFAILVREIIRIVDQHPKSITPNNRGVIVVDPWRHDDRESSLESAGGYTTRLLRDTVKNLPEKSTGIATRKLSVLFAITHVG